VVHERQGFHVLDQAGIPRFALREGGPYLVGRGDWLSQMIDTAAGAAPSWRENEAQEELLHALTSGASNVSGDDLGGRVIVATALLPNSVRDRVRREMASETAENDEASRRTMNGVLGVSGAALGITLAPAIPASPETPRDAELAVEMRCETDEACESVAKLLLAKRLALAKDLRLRFLGLGGALDSLTVEAEGRALHARLHFNPEAVLAAVQRILPSPSPRAMPAPSIAPPQALTTPASPAAPSAPAEPQTNPPPSGLFNQVSAPDAASRPPARDGGARPVIERSPNIDSRH
jgi:hypothetical protein